MKTIHEFFRPLVLEALARKEKKASQGSEEPEKIRLIDQLVEVSDDLKLIEEQLINIFLAARDTVSHSLEKSDKVDIFTPYFLCLRLSITLGSLF